MTEPAEKREGKRGERGGAERGREGREMGGGMGGERQVGGVEVGSDRGRGWGWS